MNSLIYKNINIKININPLKIIKMVIVVDLINNKNAAEQKLVGHKGIVRTLQFN